MSACLSCEGLPLAVHDRIVAAETGQNSVCAQGPALKEALSEGFLDTVEITEDHKS